MVIYKFRYISFILVCLLWSCEKDKIALYGDLIIEDVSYSFFVAGHVYGTPEPGLHPPFVSIFPSLNCNEKLEMGFLTGDVVYQSDAVSWQSAYDALEDLDVEIHIAPGNHDLNSLETYEAFVGPRFKSFLQNDDLFVVLDPVIDWWKIKGEQLEFLREALSAFDGERVFVFMHQPIWYEDDNKYAICPPNSTDGKWEPSNFFSIVLPLFHDVEAEVVLFAGDVGARKDRCAVMYDKLDNVHLVASGMGGGADDNMVLVNVMNDGSVDFDLIALGREEVDALGELEDYQIF